MKFMKSLTVSLILAMLSLTPRSMLFSRSCFRHFRPSSSIPVSKVRLLENFSCNMFFEYLFKEVLSSTQSFPRIRFNKYSQKKSWLRIQRGSVFILLRSIEYSQKEFRINSISSPLKLSPFWKGYPLSWSELHSVHDKPIPYIYWGQGRQCLGHP